MSAPPMEPQLPQVVLPAGVVVGVAVHAMACVQCQVPLVQAGRSVVPAMVADVDALLGHRAWRVDAPLHPEAVQAVPRIRALVALADLRDRVRGGVPTDGSAEVVQAPGWTLEAAQEALTSWGTGRHAGVLLVTRMQRRHARVGALS